MSTYSSSLSMSLQAHTCVCKFWVVWMSCTCFSSVSGTSLAPLAAFYFCLVYKSLCMKWIKVNTNIACLTMCPYSSSGFSSHLIIYSVIPSEAGTLDYSMVQCRYCSNLTVTVNLWSLRHLIFSLTQHGLPCELSERQILVWLECNDVLQAQRRSYHFDEVFFSLWWIKCI